MARPKQPVIEYRSYELPPDFPMITLTGDQWHISPVPSKRLHFHNCLEIGVCHSESGTMVLGSEQHAFRSGFVTCIARNVPHTTWSSPGEHSLWSYLYVDPEALIGRSGLAVMPDLNEFNRLIASCCLLLRTLHCAMLKKAPQKFGAGSMPTAVLLAMFPRVLLPVLAVLLKLQ